MKNINSFHRVLTCILFSLLVGFHVSAQSIVASGYSFSATSKTYNYLSGGTSIPAIEVDDAYTTISIGFPFKFCGTNYTDVTVSSNGWLRFGIGAGTSVANWNYNHQVASGVQPCVYVLYEDINGDAGTSSYLVTGAAGNRIFKWECRDWKWDYAATSPSLSFQVWLYEATGVVECIYKQEAGSVQVNSSGGATIGIAKSSTDWQTLDDATSNPVSSTTTYTYDMTIRPATGQSYIWDPGPACPTPSGLIVNNVNSTSVDFSWGAVSAAIGYEYIVDQNPSPLPTSTPIATINTNSTEGGLIPNSQYYIHLRSKCDANNYSSWVTLPFHTLPPCVIATPPGIIKTSLDTNSVTLAWATVNTAVDYEYILKEENNPPTGNAGLQSTSANNIMFKPLQPGKTYYFFLRVKCLGADSSGWVMDSIYVPIPCHAPDLHFTGVNTSRFVAYWNAPATSYEYEIIASKSVLANPGTGIRKVATSHQFPFLDEGTEYYVYAKSHCNDRGVITQSGWSQALVSTWALGINENMANDGGLKLYPNPAGNQLYVLLGSTPSVRNGIITITDVTGRMMKTVNSQAAESVINISSLCPGIYMLTYSTGDRRIQQRFTKL